MANPSKMKKKGREGAIVNPIMPLPPAEPELDWGGDPFLVIHYGVICNGPLCTDIHEPIRGVRYKCSVCPKRDFCESCVRQTNNSHDEKHLLFECLGPAEFVEAKTPNPEEADLLGEIAIAARPEILDLRNLSSSGIPESVINSGRDMPEVKYVPKQGFPSVLQGVKHHQDALVDVMIRRITRYDYKSSQLQQYSSTGTAFTRLVDLHPGHAGDKIEFTLRPTQLADTDRYEVLTCAWGKLSGEQHQLREESQGSDDTLPSLAEQSHAVYMDNSSFLEVSVGVSEALRELRHPDKVRTLWVEELCVDTNNKVEKNFQRRARGLIYNNADTVIVWTGHAGEQTETAFVLMAQLAYYCDGENQQLPTPKDVDENPELPSIVSEEWRALLRFFPPEVLRHRWDFEDVVFAKNATFQCGEYCLDWVEVVGIVRMLARDDWQAQMCAGLDFAASIHVEELVLGLQDIVVV